MDVKKVNAIANGAAIILGLAFLGDLLELWNFHPFDGWWVLFLYIPAISGLIINGVTSGSVLMLLTALVLTLGLVADVDGRIWCAALILYLAYVGGRSIHNDWTAPDGQNKTQE